MICNKLALFMSISNIEGEFETCPSIYLVAKEITAPKDLRLDLNFSLLVDFVDKAFFFQLPHDAFVRQVFEAKLCAGLTAGRFSNLRLGTRSSHQRYHVIEFCARGVGVLQIRSEEHTSELQSL